MCLLFALNGKGRRRGNFCSQIEMDCDERGRLTLEPFITDIALPVAAQLISPGFCASCVCVHYLYRRCFFSANKSELLPQRRVASSETLIKIFSERPARSFECFFALNLLEQSYETSSELHNRALAWKSKPRRDKRLARRRSKERIQTKFQTVFSRSSIRVRVCALSATIKQKFAIKNDEREGWGGVWMAVEIHKT